MQHDVAGPARCPNASHTIATSTYGRDTYSAPTSLRGSEVFPKVAERRILCVPEDSVVGGFAILGLHVRQVEGDASAQKSAADEKAAWQIVDSQN